MQTGTDLHASIVVKRVEKRKDGDKDRTDRMPAIFDASNSRYILDDAAVSFFSSPIVKNGVKLVQVAEILYRRDSKRRNFVTHLDGEELPKRRICLTCRTEFDSAWRGNRVCQSCKATAAWKLGEVATQDSRTRMRKGSS